MPDREGWGIGVSGDRVESVASGRAFKRRGGGRRAAGVFWGDRKRRGYHSARRSDGRPIRLRHSPEGAGSFNLSNTTSLQGSSASEARPMANRRKKTQT